MKVQFASDLHLGFKENRSFIKVHPLVPTGDILILGGDIMPLFKRDHYADFLKFCSDNFEQTYWIPGNHEYYKGNMAGQGGNFREDFLPNVHFLNNTVLSFTGLNIILSTLWTPIPAEFSKEIGEIVYDYKLIQVRDKLFTTQDSGLLFRQNFLFIKKALQESEATTNLVVTHHIPTFRNYPKEYEGNPVNAAFAVDLDDFIANSKADIWIYGHHHHNTPEFLIGRTRMITNQLGYIERNEQIGFRPNFVLEI